MPGGRPTKLTKATQETLRKALEMGHHIKDACSLAGIHKDSYFTWMKEAETADPQTRQGKRLIEFSDSMKKALTLNNHLEHIAKNGNWQARAWILERREPEKWGIRERIREAAEKLFAEWVDRLMAEVSDNARAEITRVLIRGSFQAIEDDSEILASAERNGRAAQPR